LLKPSWAAAGVETASATAPATRVRLKVRMGAPGGRRWAKLLHSVGEF
jgi:hypothetical protein